MNTRHLNATVATTLTSMLVAVGCLHAKVYEVSPDAQGKGIMSVMEAAGNGDTVILAPGTYREQVIITKSLTIRGNSGAVIDGGSPVEGQWTPADGMDQAYTLPASTKPAGLMLEGKFIAAIRYDRAQTKGEWHWRTLLQKGTPLSGFDQIRAAWMYHPKEKRIYLRLGDGGVPDNGKLTQIRTDGALIRLEANGAIIEGLTLRGGQDSIQIREGATECTVRQCKITSFERTGISITEGASHCTVEDCEITRGALEEWQPTNVNRRENYEIWRIHKDVGNYDRVGINLVRAGEGNRILRNRVDRVFDGISSGDSSAESLDKPLPDPNHGKDSEIANNVISNTRDSGIELGVGCINVNVHHNVLDHTHGGLRFKLPRLGPVFIHHNHLLNGTPFNIWFSMDASPAEGYIYHNTIEGGDDAALSYSSFNATRAFATPKWHVVNNLVLRVKDGLFSQNKKTPARDFIDSHNVVTDDPTAAREAGLDLSTYRNGKPLPGCERGYFTGRASDAGAHERSE